MQQHNHSIKQPNDLDDFERNKLQPRKVRSTSHSRLRSSTNSAKNIVTSKSIENGKNMESILYVPIIELHSIKKSHLIVSGSVLKPYNSSLPLVNCKWFQLFVFLAVSKYGENTRPLSVQSRDAYSQTESVDDELFLKDVIIRLPSASISNSKANVVERVSEFECPVECVENNNKEDQSEEVVSKQYFIMVHCFRINAIFNSFPFLKLGKYRWCSRFGGMSHKFTVKCTEKCISRALHHRNR